MFDVSIGGRGAKEAKGGRGHRRTLESVMVVNYIQEWCLKAKTKSDMFLGLYAAGAKYFKPLDTAYVIGTRWERPHKAKGPQMGASLPGSGIGKIIGDKKLHRWVIYVVSENTGYDRHGFDEIYKFTDPITCRTLGIILKNYYDKQFGKNGTNVKDSVVDAVGQAVGALAKAF